MSRRTAIGLATIVTLALAWYLATMPLELISPGRFPSPADVWLSLLDPAGYPLTTFRNDLSVADYNLIIDSPYHCAADSYQP